MKLQKIKKQLGDKISLDKKNEEEIRRIARRGVCDGKSATCQAKELSEATTEFLTFTSKGITKNQIHNYFSTENTFWQENKRKKGLKFREKDLVVYREPHTCPAAIMTKQYNDYVKLLISDTPKPSELTMKSTANGQTGDHLEEEFRA